MFRQDKPLGIIINWTLNQFLLNAIFTLFCLPIFTIGASSLALYEMEYAIHENREGSLIKDFWKAFKANFVKGLLLLFAALILLLIIGGITGTAFLLHVNLKPVLLIVAWICGGIMTWIMALVGKFEQKFSVTAMNAYLLALRNLPQTLLMSIITYGLYVLVGRVPAMFLPGYLFVLEFFVPAIAAFLCTGIAGKCLKKQFPELFPDDENKE